MSTFHEFESSISTNTLARAESSSALCERNLRDATVTLARVETVERSARTAAERAEELASNASEEHARAVEVAVKAEARWSVAQSPDLWRDVENARGTRDQAEVRARSLGVAAEAARADLRGAADRVEVARANLSVAEQAKVHADDVLRAFRADQRERDEAEAAREGRLMREREAIVADCAAFNAEVRRMAGPPLARAVDAAETLDAAVRELGAVLETLRPRWRALRTRMIAAKVLGPSQPPPRDVGLDADAVHVVGIAIRRALGPSRGWTWEFPLEGIISKGDLRGAEEDVVADVVKARTEAAEARRVAAPPPPVEAASAKSFIGRAWSTLTGVR